MAEIPKEMKKLLFGRGAKWHASASIILMYLSMVCVLVGIIGDAADRIPGLTPTNWFILAGVIWLMGMSAWFTAYFTAKEGYEK